MSISSRFADKAPKPMQKNEVQSFSIDFNKHKNCELIDKDKKKSRNILSRKRKMENIGSSRHRQTKTLMK